MLKKISVAILILLLLLSGILFFPKKKDFYVKQVISPTQIVLSDDEMLTISGVETFDAFYSEKNRLLAKKFGISEYEAFISGNLAKNWARNLLEGRDVRLKENDLTYVKSSYYLKLLNSPYCIKDGEFTNAKAFERHLKSVRKTKYTVIQKSENNFLVVKKSYYSRIFRKNKTKFSSQNVEKFQLRELDLGNFKIVLSDLTTKLKPDRNCSSDICKEILGNINHAQKTIDMAIYGYSATPQIEQALKNAIARGVKIRLVYDLDGKGENIYPDTLKLVSLISDSVSDKNSKEASAIMHNKFYIFDGKTVITGSANLSHTDMSGFNSNCILVINSSDVAKIYTDEFEQIYCGKFHNEKVVTNKKHLDNMQIYFSPQDKVLTDGVLPLIRQAKKYIYIPTFLITEKRVVEELISAKQRGVDVRVIVDALNASAKYSKHQTLRDAGVPVKVENYAGKMHSKSVIVDDKYLAIGSMNFSKSGENKNDENLVVFYSPQSAKFYREFFLYQWNKIPNKWLKYNPRAEGKDSIGSCNDGIDNDYDGLIDMEEAACK